MTNIIKRIISKRSSKLRTFEYTGDTKSIPKNITHVQFHPSVTEVHDEAFKDCTKLKEIVLSDSINIIGNGSFKGCKRLKRVVLNNGLKYIELDAFSGCLSLDSITFPSSVIYIGDRAFKDCWILKQITNMKCEVDTPKIGWDAFRGCPLAVMKFRTKIIQEKHLKELENKINEIDSTLKVRDHDLILIIPASDSAVIQFDKICNLIQYYEVKEATMLVEMAMWKSKIEQASGLDRDACRVDMPEPAKDLILKYAYTIPMYTTTNYYITYIKSSRGVELELYRVEPSDTIADFKNKLCDAKDIPVDQQQLFFHGELLHDDRTLSDCNIVMDSTIELVVIGD